MEKNWSIPLEESLFGAEDLLILVRSEDEAQALDSIFDHTGIDRQGLDVLDAWNSINGNVAYRVDAHGYDVGFARPSYYDGDREFDGYVRRTFAPFVELDDIGVPDDGVSMFE